MSDAATFVQRIKGSIFPVNVPLLKLKLAFFFVYAEWMSAFPYLALMSTKIVDFQQLAITFTCIPLSSILGPIVTGFLADKFGNYKSFLLFTALLGGFIHLPILCLLAQQRSAADKAVEIFSINNNTNVVLLDVNYENNSSTNRADLENSLIYFDYTFPVLMVIRLLGYFTMDASNMLLDSCGLAISQKHNAEFGKQKMWATCAMVVIPLICGVLIDTISEYRGFKDFSIALYISAGCSLIAVAIILQLDVNVINRKTSLLKAAKKTIRMIDVDIFFIVQIMAGACWGLHMNLFSFYVDIDLKASKSLFGGALCISGIGSVIMFWLAKIIVAKFGEANSMAFALMCYCTRFLIYYFLQNPWIILLTESIDGFSGFLALVAGNFYCAEVCAPGMPTAGMLASLNGILFAANFGAGRTFGTAIGSSLLSARGMRFNYLVFGSAAGCTAAVYMIIYHLFLVKIERKRKSMNLAHQDTNRHFPAGIVNKAIDLQSEKDTVTISNQYNREIKLTKF